MPECFFFLGIWHWSLVIGDWLLMTNEGIGLMPNDKCPMPTPRYEIFGGFGNVFGRC